MQIRALGPSDAPAFQALRLRGLRESPEAFAVSYEEEVDFPLTEIERRLEPNARSAVFGAFHGSELCAVVGVQRESLKKLAHKSFIWGVYVAPEARGCGVGVQILRHALHFAATVLEARQVNLGVNTRNTAGVALYRKLGFVEYGLERGFMCVDGVFQDDYLMVCHLAAVSESLGHAEGQGLTTREREDGTE